jgi:hypothetical protein
VVFKFLALHQVETPKNGLMPTVVSTILALDTLLSAKNLKTEYGTQQYALNRSFQQVNSVK